MNGLLWIGSLTGLMLGVCHAVYLWRNAANQPGWRAASLYRGLWAVGLWTLLGTYVLVLWCISVLAYLLVMLRPQGHQT